MTRDTRRKIEREIEAELEELEAEMDTTEVTLTDLLLGDDDAEEA